MFSGAFIDDLLRLGRPSQWKHLAKSQGLIPALFAAKGTRWATATGGLKLFGSTLTGGYATFGAPLAIFGAGMAPRHHKLSTLSGGVVPFIGSAVGAALGGGLGALAGGLVGDTMAQTGVGKAVQYFTDAGLNMPRLHTGGDYQDTEQAYTMRQAAAQEMSRSLLNARQYLGKEAAFMHA